MQMLLVTLASGAATLAATAAAARLGRSQRTRLAVAVLALYGLVLIVRPPSPLASNVAVLLAAVGVGVLVGRTLSSRGAIIAFCITIALVDLLSFGGGLTRMIIDNYREGSSNLLVYLAVTVRSQGQTVPVVGVGDMAVLAALYQGLRGVGQPTSRVVVVLLGALGSALMIGLAVGGAPALPILAVSVIAALALTSGRDAQPAPSA